jgi:hypothetical protein
LVVPGLARDEGYIEGTGFSLAWGHAVKKGPKASQGFSVLLCIFNDFEKNKSLAATAEKEWFAQRRRDAAEERRKKSKLTGFTE